MIATAFVLFFFAWVIADIESLEPIAKTAVLLGLALLFAGFVAFLWRAMP